jgi:TRAP-type C4-dicarboxylate transport system substrate-binding protein
LSARRLSATYSLAGLPKNANIQAGIIRYNAAIDRKDGMRFSGRQIGMRTLPAAIASALLFALAPGAAQAQQKTFVMKITTPTLNAAPDLFAKDFGAAVEKESGGRIKAEVYPASQLGSIPRQIEGTQFGSIQCAVIPPEFFAGVDERFEVLAAPGLVSSVELGQRLAADPAVLKLMLGLGADKGLHGVGLFIAEPSEVVAKIAIRHLADFKGKKLRIFASDFQKVAFQRLGATPVAMSPGDVMPALQQGALDGAVAGVQLLAGMHFNDAAKYITMTDHSAIFLVVECSKKWYEALPADLQQIIARNGSSESLAINPQAVEITNAARKRWVDGGGELIDLPADEHAQLLKTLASVGEDVAKSKPRVQEAYQIVTEAAQRLK